MSHSLKRLSQQANQVEKRLNRPVLAAVVVVGLSSGPIIAHAQQSAALAGATAQVLVTASSYLHDQMSNAPSPGLVQFDARSLTRLLPDSAAMLRPRVAQALGVGLADEARLNSCKPVRSANCELGTAEAVLEIRSVTINGAHSTVEIRKYERRAGTLNAMGSEVLRFDLLLANTGWVVSKYAVVSG